MGELAPSLTYHYWGMGYDDSSKGMKVLTRGTEFDHQKEITFEDDEGHMGTGTTKMSAYRATATAAPSWTDKTRYKEGWEDIWYLLLGSEDAVSHKVRKSTVDGATGVFDYIFAQNATNPQDPLFCTVFNGFAKTTNDAFVYENCLLNEFELTGSNEEAPTYTVTFASNYPKFNQPNPARVFPKRTVFTKPSEVTLYIAPQGEYTAETDLEQYKYPCFIEWSLNVNNNVETQPCSSDDFGTSTKVLGDREAEFSATVPWTEATKFLEYQFMGNDKNATNVSEENDIKTVWIVMKSAEILSAEGTGTGKYYTTTIKIPEIVLTAGDSDQAGDEAKQIVLEGKIQENGTDSFIETEIRTDLANLNVGVAPADSP